MDILNFGELVWLSKLGMKYSGIGHYFLIGGENDFGTAEPTLVYSRVYWHAMPAMEEQAYEQGKHVYHVCCVPTDYELVEWFRLNFGMYIDVCFYNDYTKKQLVYKVSTKNEVVIFENKKKFVSFEAARRDAIETTIRTITEDVTGRFKIVENNK